MDENLIEKIDHYTIKKTVNKGFIDVNKTWFEYYSQLSKNNKYLVKIFTMDAKTNSFTMENLGEVTSVEQCLKQSDKYVTKKVLCDIILALTTTWAQGIEFSKLLDNDKFFVHTDLSLCNIVMTKDKQIKVIDPDSYTIVEKLKFTEKFYMSQINLMANIGIYYNIKDN